MNWLNLPLLAWFVEEQLRLPGFAVFADAQIMIVVVRITNRRKYHSTFMLDLRHTAIVMLQQRHVTLQH